MIVLSCETGEISEFRIRLKVSDNYDWFSRVKYHFCWCWWSYLKHVCISISNASSLTHQLCWCSRTSVYERVPERDVVSHDCSHISRWNDLLLLRHRCVWEWFRRLKANCSRTCSSHHLQPPSYPPPSCGSHAAIYEVNADDWMCSLRYIWSCSRTCLATSNAYSKDW